MNELIKIGVNKNKESVVSGRLLHEALKVKTKYTDWFNRHLKYGYEEDIDYVVSLKNEKNLKKNSLGGRPAIDHGLTLDMAKEVCMLQKTKIGREIRLYFIRFEKERKKFPNDALAKILHMPSTENQLKRNRHLELKGWSSDDINFRQLVARSNILFRETIGKYSLKKNQYIELQRMINQGVFGMDAADIKKEANVSQSVETRNILPENTMLLNLLFVETQLTNIFDKYDDLTYYNVKEKVINICDTLHLIEDSSLCLNFNNNVQKKLDEYLNIPEEILECI